MATKNRLRVIPLGGAGEVGRNCWALEYENDVLILDMGVMFPDAEMLGVDLILPDVTYLQERKANIRGVFITHGHEDHIGAIPYLLPQLGFPPVYATPLTLGLNQAQRQRRRIDRRESKLRQQVGDRADVVLVSVGDEHATNIRCAFLQIRYFRQVQIDA